MPTVPKQAEELSCYLLITLFPFLKHRFSFYSHEAKAILAHEKETILVSSWALYGNVGNAVIQLGALEFHTHSLGRVRATVLCHMVAQEGTNFCSWAALVSVFFTCSVLGTHRLVQRIPCEVLHGHVWTQSDHTCHFSSSDRFMLTFPTRRCSPLSQCLRWNFWEHTLCSLFEKGRSMFNKLLPEDLNLLHISFPCPLLPFYHQILWCIIQF